MESVLFDTRSHFIDILKEENPRFVLNEYLVIEQNLFHSLIFLNNLRKGTQRIKMKIKVRLTLRVDPPLPSPPTLRPGLVIFRGQ